MERPRWATFDCYGTLVDWNAGIGAELGRLFGVADRDRLLERYHALEPRVQRGRPDASYRDVMATVLAELASQSGVELPEQERDALGRSLPAWPVFGEVPAQLSEARRRGWRLVALTNSDRDFIDASARAIGVPLDDAIVASEIGSYKPALGHWRVFAERTGAEPTATSTSRRATSTTSSRRPSWASAPSGSTASTRARSRRPPASCPIS